MYKVYYYNSNRMHSKVFPTLHEAINFSVYKVPFGQCGEIIKVKE